MQAWWETGSQVERWLWHAISHSLTLFSLPLPLSLSLSLPHSVRKTSGVRWEKFGLLLTNVTPWLIRTHGWVGFTFFVSFFTNLNRRKWGQCKTGFLREPCAPRASKSFASFINLFFNLCPNAHTRVSHQIHKPSHSTDFFKLYSLCLWLRTNYFLNLRRRFCCCCCCSANGLQVFELWVSVC